MNVTTKENALNGGVDLFIDGVHIGCAQYNFEGELSLKSMIALTAEQLILVAKKLKQQK